MEEENNLLRINYGCLSDNHPSWHRAPEFFRCKVPTQLVAGHQVSKLFLSYRLSKAGVLSLKATNILSNSLLPYQLYSTILVTP